MEMMRMDLDNWALRTSPQGLNRSSIGVFDQIRDPEIPICLRQQFLIILNIFIFAMLNHKKIHIRPELVFNLIFVIVKCRSLWFVLTFLLQCHGQLHIME